MELKPGYQLTEVGVIPEDWEISTVGCEFEIQLGKMLDAAKNVGILKPYLGNKAVQWDRIDTEDLPMMAMSRWDMSRFRLCSGDLLVCEGGEVGRGAIWEAPLEECYYQKALHRLRPLRGYSPQLLLAYLRYWMSHGMLSDFVSQTSIAHLTREKFAEVPLPVPHRTEQRAIVTAISDVDALIAKLDALIAKKRDIKQATMQQLLSGKQRLPGFSGEWEMKRLGEVADIDGDSLGADTPPHYQFRYISLEDVDRGSLKSFTQEYFTFAPSRARRRIRPGDILVSTVRPNLMSHLLFTIDEPDWVCSTGFSVVRCRQKDAYPGYIFAHFFGNIISKQVEALLTGSSYPAISGADVRSLRLRFPSVAEQTAIATVLSDMDAEITALEAQRDKTRVLKQGMMQELLTGRIRLV